MDHVLWGSSCNLKLTGHAMTLKLHFERCQTKNTMITRLVACECPSTFVNTSQCGKELEHVCEGLIEIARERGNCHCMHAETREFKTNKQLKLVLYR